MKRITCMLAAAVFSVQVCGITAFADFDVRADLSGNIRVTDYSGENTERGIGIMPSAGGGQTQEEIFGDMAYVNQMGAGEKTIIFRAPELVENERYRLSVRSEYEDDAETHDFEWISPSAVADNFYPSLNAQNMYSAITSAEGLKILDLYCGNVSELSAEGKAALAGYLVNADLSGAADFVKKCSRAAAALSLCDISDGEISAAENPLDVKLARLCDDLEISDLPEYSSYCLRGADFKANLSKRINGSRERAAADFAGYFTEQFYLARIETAKNYSQISSILMAMSQKCGLDLSKYNVFSDKRKIDTELAGMNFEDIKSLEEQIAKYVNPAPTVTPGGGGSGGGGSKISTGTLPAETPAPGGKESGYNDVDDSHWASEAITVLSSRGVLSGYGNGDFRPENSVTRAEFLTMLLRAFDLTDGAADGGFTDTAEDAWYYRYAAAGKKYGVTGGYEDGSFRAENSVTRQEAACMLVNASNVRAIPLASIRDFDGFADDTEIADYAAENVRRLFCAGIISGYGNGSFTPCGVLTRAEAAQMIFQLLKLSV